MYLFVQVTEKTYKLSEFSTVPGHSSQTKQTFLSCIMNRFSLFCIPEIYTIHGNAQGHPCYFPFLYDDQWFHNCTSIGREDGFLWCATTSDYSKDEQWGFCPIKSEDAFVCSGHFHSSFLKYFLRLTCSVPLINLPPPSLSGATCETFWETDPLTDSCYQLNIQATLSWTEARISCQQQGADLLSITKLHEQTYINGTNAFTSLRSFLNSSAPVKRERPTRV